MTYIKDMEQTIEDRSTFRNHVRGQSVMHVNDPIVCEGPAKRIMRLMLKELSMSIEQNVV